MFNNISNRVGCDIQFYSDFCVLMGWIYFSLRVSNSRRWLCPLTQSTGLSWPCNWESWRLPTSWLWKQRYDFMLSSQSATTIRIVLCVCFWCHCWMFNSDLCSRSRSGNSLQNWRSVSASLVWPRSACTTLRTMAACFSSPQPLVMPAWWESWLKGQRGMARTMWPLWRTSFKGSKY